MDLVPSGLDHMYLVFSNDDLVATEGLSSDELAESICEEAGVDSAFDTDCDGGAQARQTVTSAVAITAVDTLHMYFSSLEFSNDFGLQLGDMEVAVLKSALTRHV